MNCCRIRMPTEEEIRKNLQVLEYYRENLSSLEMQMQYTQAALADFNKARLTIQQIEKKESEKTEVMFPLGGGSFISGSLKSGAKILVDVGKGIVMEKSAKEAIVKLDQRIKTLQDSNQKIAEMMTKMEAEANKLSEETQKMMEQAGQ